MNPDGGATQMSITSTSTNEFSTDFNSGSKYGGLIQQRWTKIIRNMLFTFLSYMDSIVKTFSPLHAVVSIWRLLQLWGPSLCASYIIDNKNSRTLPSDIQYLWKKGIPRNVIGIFSILFHIVPSFVREKCSNILNIIFIAITALFFLIWLSSATYLKKTAKLPNGLVIFINIMITSFITVISPIMLNLAGESLSRAIWGGENNENEDFGMVSTIVIVVLSVIACFVIFMTFRILICVSLIFRPFSLQAILPKPQSEINFCTYIVTFIMAIGSQLGKIPKLVLMGLSLVVYLLSIRVPFLSGTIINLTYRKAFLAASISSSINVIFFAIFIILDMQATQIILFVLVAIYAICYLISHFIIQRYINSKLYLLDLIVDDKTMIDTVATADKMAGLICTSMQYAHPTMNDWELFKVATERWPDSQTIWMLYAKFVAIYPEETNILAYIVRNIITHNLKGFTIKQMVAQTGTIQMQRECTLTSDLKRKLNVLSKTVTQTKTKLRHIWDLVIQGNIAEMDPAVDAGCSSVDQCKNDFLHALSQYPNNRFVARSYSRFILEVLGDQESFNDWREKINSLKNGVLINQDLAHTLGIEALPLMLNHTNSANTMMSISPGESETISGFDVDIADGENTQAHFEQTKMIMEKIKGISIPSLNCAIIWSVILFLVVFIVIPIIMIIISKDFISDIRTPLDFLYHMAMVKNYNFMIPLWTHHFALEHMPDMQYPKTKTVFSPPDYTDIDMDAFGNLLDSREQAKYLCKECSNSLEAISQFHRYKPDDEYLKKARSILYDSVLVHHYYNLFTKNDTKFTYREMQLSLQTIMINNIVLISDFLKIDLKANPSAIYTTFNSPSVLNSFMSAHRLNVNITSVLDYTIRFITDLSHGTDRKYMLITIGVCISAGLIFIISLIVIIVFIGKNKATIYKCLTALPKNVVSSVSESLRILKKDGDGYVDSTRTSPDQENDVSKQEDSIMKMFATAGDSSSSLSKETIAFIFIYIFYTIFAVFLCYVTCDLMPKIAKSFEKNSPHIAHTLGISSAMMSIELSLNDGVVGTNGYGPPPVPKQFGVALVPSIVIFTRMLEYIDDFFTAYQNVKYGSQDNTIQPYGKFNEIIHSLNVDKFCHGKINETTTMRNAVDCINYEYQIMMFFNLVMKVAFPYITSYEKGDPIIFDPDEDIIQAIWYLTVKLYCEAFFPMFEEIIPTMNDKMNNVISVNIPYIIILIIVGFIALFIFIVLCFIIRKKLVFALSLLLNCNPIAVTSTTKIMEVLNGHFSNETKDLTNRDQIYYDSILMEMPNAIIVCDQNFKLIQSNRAFDRLFGKNKLEDGDDVKQFFTNSSIFVPNEAFNDFTITNNHECTLMIKQEDETIVHLQTNVLAVGSNYSITMSDVSQIVSYNQLIKEEKSKSDKLLASILPPNLVARVQAGEKKISFAVPSATILFMDIVEFTPWCASGTATGVMSILNLLYRYFDASLAQGKTLTKIKCIGDCYMAAGGIFSELNQPAVHAKEAVEFGLAAIDNVMQLNQEKNEKLQIRVGINTGGPVVAGVLGTEKPTFEIFGPAISMAQQMEHHGVPMKVHISRSVYELIYGGPIKIKERGQIEIKKGKVVTYLVEGKSE